MNFHQQQQQPLQACYSDSLLDSCGKFCSQKFLRAFLAAAAQEGLPYPHPPSLSYSAPSPEQSSYTPPIYYPRQETPQQQPWFSSDPIAAGGGGGPSVRTTPISQFINTPSSSSLPEARLQPELEEISDVDESDDEEENSPSHSAAPIEPGDPISSSSSLPPPPPPPPCSEIRHRLKLVLDLDNTLLHACAKSKIGDCDINLEDFVSPEGEPELYKFVLPKMINQIYYVKLRPGLRRFLNELSVYCDLAIHTNATREYAEVIVAVLDPDRTLFRGRIAAREDEFTRDHKKNMDRLFGIEDLDISSLVILDDRKDVWDNMYQPNIIHCGMYDYLDSRKTTLVAKYSSTADTSYSSTSADQNDNNNTVWDAPFLDNPLVALSADGDTGDDDCEDGDLIAPPTGENGTSVSAMSNGSAPNTGLQNDDVSANYFEIAAKVPSLDEQLIDYDEQLEWLRKLIISVAREYNDMKSGNPSTEDISVVNLLSSRRKAILAGVVVQTAGMYKSLSSHPEYGWHDNGPVHRRRLVALGADVVEAAVNNLTHLLAIRATQSIDRVRKERGDQVKYVHALWLHACESTWSKIPEEWFPAVPLLKNYENAPPKKPWVDHWKILTVHGGGIRNTSGCPERLASVMRALGMASPAKQSVPATTPVSRVHLVTASFSHGAHIWSHKEHIALTFDPIPSSTLKMQLQSDSPDIAVSGPKKRQRQQYNHQGSDAPQEKHILQHQLIESSATSGICTNISLNTSIGNAVNSTRNFKRRGRERTGFDDWSYPAPHAAATAASSQQR